MMVRSRESSGVDEAHAAADDTGEASAQHAGTPLRAIAFGGPQDYAAAIVETVREPLLILDAGLRVQWANRAFYHTFGVSPADTEGQHLYDLGNGQWDIPALRRLLEEILPENTSFNDFVVEHDFPRIGPRTMLLNARRLQREESEPLILLAFEDATQRQRAQQAVQAVNEQLVLSGLKADEQLADADRQKDEFLAMLAHELRNPLAPIRHAAELLQCVGRDEPRLQKAREIIVRQVTQQSRLLDDLLDVSRIARGKILLRAESLDLVPLVRDAVEDCRGVLEAAGLTLSLELPEGPVRIEGDPTRLTQIVGNLLNNAAKFTDAGGTVGVRCWVLGVGSDPTDPTRTPNTQHPTPAAVITVRDTGIGIEPAMLPHVFESFTQADRSRDRSRGGLGLGLALVKGLVELHGGQVRAESEGPGRGAVFTVTLPILDPGSPISDSTEPVQGGAAATLPDNPEIGPVADAAGQPGSRRVLIIDDNRDAVETLRDLLAEFGYTLAVAHAGPEGVSEARRFRPEVVICDLGLPGMDGYRVAAALRQDPVTAAARLIVVSGYGGEEEQRRARAAGFDDYLIKPVDIQELQRRLAGE